MKKIIFILIFLFFTTILTGCWENNNNNSLKINFDKFQLQLENKDNWIIVSPSSISNTQIVEKIIKIIKSKNNKNINIIIAKSEIKRSDIDFKTFVNANIEKFNKLIWYKLEKLEFEDIKCKNKNIPIAIHYFNLDQSLLKTESKKYFFWQIYIYLKKYGYIIQIYSPDEENVKNLTKKIIENLKCK